MLAMLTLIGLVVGGLLLLVLGGELLVRGASWLAGAMGISPLVIGLTVVAFGTSAPELAVSLKACLGGQTDVAVGNVVGSNIFNVLFILGAAALISPLIVSSQLIRIDVPIMIAASFAVLLLGLDGAIGRVDGLGLFIALVVYVLWTVRKSRQESAAVKAEFGERFPTQQNRAWLQVVWQCSAILCGLALLTLGARFLVDGSVSIARLAGMSELLIGLTIVAAGTSLPEVATSILASMRGERDIAVGNVVGSNIFNITCVLGLSAIVVPGGVAVSEQVLWLDVPVMIGVAVACLPIFITGHMIARWEGGVFLGYYFAYTAYLVLAATLPSVSRTFGMVMVAFVLPLTAIPLVVGLWRSWQAARGQQAAN